MKKYSLLILIWFVYLDVQGQDSLDIIGKWKPIIASSDRFYYDFRTDSFFLSEKAKSPSFPDSLIQEILLIDIRLYGNQFLFGDNYTYKQYLDDYLLFEDKYELLNSENSIILTRKDHYGKKMEMKLNYYYKNNKLLIVYKKNEIEFVLERQQK